MLVRHENILIDLGALTPMSYSPTSESATIEKTPWSAPNTPPQIRHAASEELLPQPKTSGRDISLERRQEDTQPDLLAKPSLSFSSPTDRSGSPPPLSANDAVNRAKSLSKKLSVSNIPSRVTDTGDLMLDMTGYKSSEDEALRAEVVARKILAEELEGNYDIGALIGADDQGNLWIYSSEEAKEAAGRKLGIHALAPGAIVNDAASDPGYGSDEDTLSSSSQHQIKRQRAQSDSSSAGLVTPPQTPPTDGQSSGDPTRNYAKTLRLTSDQLKALKLKPGENSMSFSVNRATCQAHMYYWTYDVPIVISDIDGTITK